MKDRHFDKLKLCIEKCQPKKFVDHLNVLLEDSSFDIDQPFFKDGWNHTLFSYACMHGNLEICKYLASKGAAPLGSKSTGEGFPLTVAVLNSHFHIADWIQKEVNIDCSIGDSASLKLSAKYGNLDGVKYALDHGADIHAGKDFAVQWASRGGHLEVVKFLVSKGADLHAQEETSTIWAAASGHLEVVKYLASEGAALEAQNGEALRLAAQYGHLDVVEYLVSKGAGPQAVKDRSLLAAVHNNRFEIAECLLEHGADPNAKTKKRTLLQLLVSKRQYDLAVRAVKYGADMDTLPASSKQRLKRYMMPKKMARRGRL